MKKILLSAVAVFAFGFANAQDIKTDAGTFTKPISGTYIMEATMTPDLTGGGIFSLPSLNSDLGMLGIKVRKFSSDTKAMRMGANLTIMNSGEDNVDTEFSVGASIGVEHHMKGAERLSTYWGYEGNIGYACGLTKATMHFVHFQFEAAWDFNKLSFIVVPMLFPLWLKSIYDIQGKRMPGVIGNLMYGKGA